MNMPGREEDVLTRLVREERQEKLRERINQLPAQHRDIITAYYLSEKNYEQIARDAQVAVKTVESRLYRARQWIRNHWKEDEWLMPATMDMAHITVDHIRGRHTKENTLIRKATWDRWRWTKKEYISIKAVSMASPKGSLGHLHLGLLHRGLSFLIAFFGSFAMMVFVASITNESVFLMFLLILPVIWVYCMFDAVQHVHRKQAGEVLQDRTLFEELEMGRASGRRSKVLATLLSAFPGAGHLYLGLQKRGMQLMFLFLGSIYILDLLRLSVFLFMIPLIWFYSFFDGLQCSSRYGREPLTDQPIFKDWARHQRLIGFGIAALGLYYLVIRLVIPQLNEMFPNVFMTYEIRSYVNTVIVSLLLIFGGLKLLFGKQRGASANSAVHRNEEGADSLFLFKDRDDRL
ncbi:hypothetical protein G195_003008 [Phytophthora kernoviae 00238/432]|uniref:RNA polymerase sigma factor 70 region 4 type 2 domain-containing protein n=1 Tax=Phytophthora kernoviae 00238/432 TaxID=1284355 RepID=A0A8J4SEZ4_9STRA|nr:hypothetical protein G195_003008 [Phytophthora kernoviae 00238/432]